jgi:mRNA-degrading endonuclease RelE of RelBE toxin-antitoxin system
MLWPRTRSILMHLRCFVTTRLLRSIHLFLVCADVARYKILFKATVVRDYEAIASKADRRRVLGMIASLTTDPRPAKARNLPEHEDRHRICLKHHRVIYEIDDSQKQVTVFRIAHRGRRDATW